MCFKDYILEIYRHRLVFGVWEGSVDSDLVQFDASVGKS